MLNKLHLPLESRESLKNFQAIKTRKTKRRHICKNLISTKTPEFKSLVLISASQCKPNQFQRCCGTSRLVRALPAPPRHSRSPHQSHLSTPIIVQEQLKSTPASL